MVKARATAGLGRPPLWQKWWVVCVETGGSGGWVLFDTNVFFFPYGHLVWWGEKPHGLLIKCRVWVRRRGGDYGQANKLKYCPNAVCLCMWARLTAPEAFTPAASSAIFELLWPRLRELSCETCRHVHNSIPFWWEGSFLKPLVGQIAHERHTYIKVSPKLGGGQRVEISISQSENLNN